MSDIAERLLAGATADGHHKWIVTELHKEAAAAIRAHRAEIDRLKQELDDATHGRWSAQTYPKVSHITREQMEAGKALLDHLSDAMAEHHVLWILKAMGIELAREDTGARETAHQAKAAR